MRALTVAPRRAASVVVTVSNRARARWPRTRPANPRVAVIPPLAILTVACAAASVISSRPPTIRELNLTRAPRAGHGGLPPAAGEAEPGGQRDRDRLQRRGMAAARNRQRQPRAGSRGSDQEHP